MDLKLQQFQPGIYIEISDVMQGFRKIGLVTEGGDMYLDLANDRATPLPIYAAMQPIAIGNSVSWALELADQRPAEHGEFTELQTRVLSEGLDTITANRALYWAYQNHVYDASRAIAAGRAATAQVESSRQMMDGLIVHAASA